MANKSKKKYFNYVEYARKLNDMSHEELQTEMEFRSVALRMCEQELRARRHNQKIMDLAKYWTAQEKMKGIDEDGANQGTK